MDVFTVNKVKLDREGKVTPTVISSHPFFEEWSQLTIEDVVHHTTFLRTYVTKPFYFSSNLLLTEQFLINNMDDDLYCKCLETYQYQPPSARGGPLLFITMLKELVENKQDIARSLFIKLQSLKLSDFEGENVTEGVSTIRQIIKRLHAMERKDPTDATGVLNPLNLDDLSLTLIRLFQTSAEPEFSSVFHCLKAGHFVDSNLTTKPDDVLSKAAALYTHLKTQNKWSPSSVKTPDDATFMAALLAGKICWNCELQEGHTAKECRKPRNKANIQKNAKLYLSGKWKNANNSTTNQSENSAGRGKEGRGRNNRRDDVKIYIALLP
jgi:ribosomal protein L40E